MIRAIIADDERLSRRVIQQLLQRHPDIVVVAECADGAEARDAVVSVNPDVMFLDIRMPLESGLDVARHRDARTGPFVVFITAFEKFALPAFDADAVDYLTKPLTQERFDAALDRVRERLRLRRLDATVVAVAAEAYPDHLVSRVGTRDMIVPVDAIDYIEADDVYAVVVTGQKRHLVRVSLDALERTLDPARFARVHRSFIVRLNRVREVRRNGAVELILHGGMVVPVSRRRRAAIDALLRPLAT